MIGSLTTVYNEIVQQSIPLDRLTLFLHEHLKELSADTQDQSLIYRNIKKLSPELAQLVKIIEMRADILRSGCPNEKILDLIGSSTVPGEELEAIKELKRNPCSPEVDKELSRLIALTLRSNVKELASWIDQNKIPLADLDLTTVELEAIAPHLHYVDCRGLDINQRFIYFCVSATHLFIKSDKITKLDVRGSNLQTLDISGSQLTELTCWHKDSLISLTLSDVPQLGVIDCAQCPALVSLSLTNVPALRQINCQSCTSLASLTLAGCPELRTISSNDCTALATFSVSEAPLLNRLYIHGCQNLTTLPLSLGQSPDLAYINIDFTGIDRAFRDAILNQGRRMRDAEAVNILPSRLEKWKVFAKSGEILDISPLSIDQKMILNEWLIRLERTKDFRHSQALLAATVCMIIADLFKNKEFQELFFSQAEANNACCEDRAAMSLNEIYTSWKILCTPEDLKVMPGVAKTLRLRKELQKLIKGEERESVEIFLYYESTLRERLQLVTAIQNMTYSQIGKRDWIDKDRLVQEVEAHFFEELIEFPMFEKMIDLSEEFATQLEQLGECPKGGPNDPQVLNYQFKQGEIMQEWKRKKMLLAKKWCEKVMS